MGGGFLLPSDCKKRRRPTNQFDLYVFARRNTGPKMQGSRNMHDEWGGGDRRMELMRFVCFDLLDTFDISL
ncbi:hypothetical protein Pla52o_07900 [Novipirellula galeiformis]|uniref:Uncharacterized protein n=1 Tax=Novipirellula galeiformis TaxID=2528004 RepID=A0A5C6CTJ2_9BACT|nr:hypothetical protein Pla52o_07900 [Novipirellula galeiformis]